MCGIVGAIAQRPVEHILIEGLKRLEYRGYDSAGVALLDTNSHELCRQRVLGKVAGLETALNKSQLTGTVGIAHTRWATHGKPTENNAHPHCSQDRIAIVHNGIIENHQNLREMLESYDYHFESDTDTEIIVHLIHHHLKTNPKMIDALRMTVAQLKGAYALCILSTAHPDELYVVRSGSPLVIGLGIGENFIASDPLALIPVTQKFIYLEEGDLAKVTRTDITIYDQHATPVDRTIHESELENDAANKGAFRHFMLKEIYDQPEALAHTLEQYLALDQIGPNVFGVNACDIFPKIQRIQIIACGTSFHAGLVASYWLESIAKLPVKVDIASEYRYRNSVIEPNTLFVAISQSGETADTLAAIRHAKQNGCQHVLAICNAPESSLARESDLLFVTLTGKEVGVAATKTFTGQLCALALLTLAFGHMRNTPEKTIRNCHKALKTLPGLINDLLALDETIQSISRNFIKKHSALFVGRGELYPIAAEGALKLKEISYIHAEAYPAGELKHGPLALVDKEMPVIVIAPDNALFEKLASNIEEIHARDGEVYVFSNKPAKAFSKHITHIQMPKSAEFITPITYTIPMQLLSYHIAVLKGTDVDQPRNLAKSVTVE